MIAVLFEMIPGRKGPEGNREEDQPGAVMSRVGKNPGDESGRRSAQRDLKVAGEGRSVILPGIR